MSMGLAYNFASLRLIGINNKFVSYEYDNVQMDYPSALNHT